MNRQRNQQNLCQRFLMVFHSGNLFQLLKTTKLQFFSLRKIGTFNMGKNLKYRIFQGTEISSSAWIKAVAQNLQPLHAWNQNLKCVWKVTQAPELSLFASPRTNPISCVPCWSTLWVYVPGVPAGSSWEGIFRACSDLWITPPNE